MPTKLFLTNKLSEYVDSVPRGNWDTFSLSFFNSMIDTHKYGEPYNFSVVTSPIVLPSKIPNVWSIGTYRAISRRLLPQTISGTFNILIFAKETGSISTFTRAHIYVIDTTAGDNAGTVFGELRTIENGPGPELTWSFGFLLPVRWDNPALVNPVTIPDDGRDYRLVVEIGCVTHQSNMVDPITNLPTTTLVATQQVGVRGIDYVPMDDTITPEKGASYIEFSADITFKEFQLPYNHELELSLDLNPRSTATVTPYKTHPLWYRTNPYLKHETVLMALACGTPVRSKVALYTQDLPLAVFAPVKFLIESEWNGVANHSHFKDRYHYYKTWTELSTSTPYTLHVDFYDFVPGESGDLLLTATDNKPNYYDSTIIGLAPTLLRIGTSPGPIRAISGRFTSSRLAVALYAGRFGMVNEVTGELFIYGKAPLFHLLNRVPTNFTTGIKAIGTDFLSFFIVGGNANLDNGTTRFMIRIDHNGNRFPRPFFLPFTDASQLMGVSRDSKSLYYGRNIRDGKVQKHDLVVDASLPEFVNAPADYIPKYVIVMSDETICCLFSHYLGGLNYLYHYDLHGIVLHSRPLDFLGNGVVVSYICHTHDDNPDRLWIRYHDNVLPEIDYLMRFEISTANTYTLTENWYAFNEGKGPTGAACDQLLWGAQKDGAMVMMMQTPDVSGLYFLNSANKHDSLYYAIDVKIPDPTIRTALIGE